MAKNVILSNMSDREFQTKAGNLKKGGSLEFDAAEAARLLELYPEELRQTGEVKEPEAEADAAEKPKTKAELKAEKEAQEKAEADAAAAQK